MADTSNAFDQRRLRDALSQWEAKTDPKAALTTLQKDVFIELSSFASVKPLPTNVLIKSNHQGIVST